MCMVNNTKVVHCKKSPYDLYIGRGSKWGNDFSWYPGTKAKHIVKNREESISEYRKWILTQPALLNSLHELAGKTLGCYCSPLDCHGNVLIELVNKHVQFDENGKVLSWDIFCNLCGSNFEHSLNGEPFCENGHSLRL